MPSSQSTMTSDTSMASSSSSDGENSLCATSNVSLSFPVANRVVSCLLAFKTAPLKKQWSANYVMVNHQTEHVFEVYNSSIWPLGEKSLRSSYSELWFGLVGVYESILVRNRLNRVCFK